jgi:hypothetical protein
VISIQNQDKKTRSKRPYLFLSVQCYPTRYTLHGRSPFI